MGKYIKVNSQGDPLGTTFDRKVESLIKDGAVVTKPFSFEPNLVCVIDFGVMSDVCFLTSQAEFFWFNRHEIKRKVWLKYKHAESLAQ